jgi:hypothetical protein
VRLVSYYDFGHASGDYQAICNTIVHVGKPGLYSQSVVICQLST